MDTKQPWESDASFQIEREPNMHHYDLDPTGYFSATSETLVTSTLGWVYKLGRK